jgi:DNA-directed RNA polymerase III subunit RPC6
MGNESLTDIKQTFPPEGKRAAQHRKLVPNALYPISRTSKLLTPHQLLDMVNASKLTDAKLSVENIMECMRAAELDGSVEAIKPIGGVDVPDLSDSDDDGPSKKRRKTKDTGDDDDDDLDDEEKERRATAEKEKARAKAKEKKRREKERELEERKRQKEKEKEKERRRKEKEKEKKREKKKKKEKEKRKKEKEKEKKKVGFYHVEPHVCILTLRPAKTAHAGELRGRGQR